MFQHLPFLQSHYPRLAEILDEWREYKQSVPTYGAALLSEHNTHVLLVQSYWAKSSWGFPKGKVNEDEDPAHCAIREVYEETGFDITEYIDPNFYFESIINDQLVRLYVITGISLKTKFQPRTRYEIKACEWFPIADLPNSKKDNTPKVKMGVNANSFFMVLPFVKRLKSLSVQFDIVKNEHVNEAIKNDYMKSEAMRNASLKNGSHRNDSLGNVTLRNDSLRNDSLRNDSLRNNSLRNDLLRNESMRNNSNKNEFARNDSSRTTKNDTVRHDTTRNDSARNDSIKTDAMKNDSIKNDSMKNNSIKNDSMKNDSIKNDSTKNFVKNEQSTKNKRRNRTKSNGSQAESDENIQGSNRKDNTKQKSEQGKANNKNNHSKRQLFSNENEGNVFSAPSWLNFKFDVAALMECIS